MADHQKKANQSRNDHEDRHCGFEKRLPDEPGLFSAARNANYQPANGNDYQRDSNQKVLHFPPLTLYAYLD